MKINSINTFNLQNDMLAIPLLGKEREREKKKEKKKEAKSGGERGSIK